MSSVGYDVLLLAIRGLIQCQEKMGTCRVVIIKYSLAVYVLLVSLDDLLEQKDISIKPGRRVDSA